MRLRRVLLAPLRVLRSILLTALIAFARALGGRVPHPKPEPRNLAAEVERRR
jgi:hypothetical protein